MSNQHLIDYKFQVAMDDPTVSIGDGGTFCIIGGNSELEVDESLGQYIIGDVGVADDSLQAALQMVPISQVTSKRISAPSVPTEDKVKCHLCSKTYSSNNYLKDHMRTHTGEKPFTCEECGAAFSQKCNLRMHQRIHSGERPFMCGICGRTFNRSSHLKNHMIQHTGDKPYQCETCGQKFTNMQGKKNHMKLHIGERPFQCELCNKYLNSKAALKFHIKQHGKESKYFCTICKRKFLLRSALFEHMTFHSDTRSYACDKCHKRFKQKHYFNRHKRTNCSGDKSLLDNPLPQQSNQRSNDVSRLKYHVLSSSSKAQPTYTDSDEELCDDNSGSGASSRGNVLRLTDSQQNRLHLISGDSDDYLDGSYVKLLKRVGFVPTHRG